MDGGTRLKMALHTVVEYDIGHLNELSKTVITAIDVWNTKYTVHGSY